ncbi:unnamed protein product [Diplocarpon coronariae]
MGIAPATGGPILIDQNSPGPDATVDGRRRYTSQAAYGPGVLGWAHRHRRHRRHRHPAMGWCGGELDLTGLIYVGSRGQQTPRFCAGGGEGEGGEKEEEEEEYKEEKEEEEEKKEKEGEEEEYKEEKEEEEEKEKEETYLHL